MFTRKKKSLEPQEQRNLKRAKSKTSVCKPNLTDASRRRSTHHKGVNFDAEFVPSSPEIEIMEQNKTKHDKETQDAVMEESPVTPIRMSKRVKEASQTILKPVEKSICKSAINKPKKKTAASGNEIKTPPKLPIEDKIGNKTSELVEEVNKKVDSPKVVFDKEEEGSDDQQIPSIPIRGIVKEEKFKDPE